MQTMLDLHDTILKAPLGLALGTTESTVSSKPGPSYALEGKWVAPMTHACTWFARILL